MAKVRIQPQYKPHPTKTVITGYLVYAWANARKYAAGLRKLIKGGK